MVVLYSVELIICKQNLSVTCMYLFIICTQQLSIFYFFSSLWSLGASYTTIQSMLNFVMLTKQYYFFIRYISLVY